MHILVKSLNFSYKNQLILNNINLSINKGDTLVVLGHNGAGKSTLIKCMLNEIPTPKKSIWIDNVDVHSYTNWEKIGYVPQEVNIMGFPISVREFLLSFVNKKYSKKKIEDIIDMLDITAYADKNINTLSGGQKRRVYIARALLNDIEILVLDEPFVAIDEKSIKDIKTVLKSLRKQSISIIIITHNFHIVEDLASHICLLENNVKFYGTVAEFKENEKN
ncbi:MAG: metal ABC transporter ATP-binding protein [Lachnospirales bacterium]